MGPADPFSLLPTVASRRRLPGLFFAFVLASSGCVGLDPNPDRPATGSLQAWPRTMVHGSDGKILADSDYPGQPPRLVQRFVGDAFAAEPAVEVGTDGTVFFATKGEGYGDPTGARAGRVFVSRDEGFTWEETTPRLLGQRATSGGDPDLYRDPLTGRVFFQLYTGHACLEVFWTDDQGRTWSTSRACDTGTDYPSIFSAPSRTLPTQGYPNIVYACYNGLTAAQCSRSLDGGVFWTKTMFPYPENLESRPLAFSGFLGYDCAGNTHAGRAGIGNQRDGTIYIPKGFCGKSTIAASTDAGVSWRRIIVDETVGVWAWNDQEARLALDAAGNLYYFWQDKDMMPRLAISRDEGATWGPPLNVSVPGLTVAMHPSLVAGDEGKVAFSYIGSRVRGGWDASATDATNATWHSFVGFTLNALDESPVFATTTVDEPGDPLHRGPCYGGIRCYPYPCESPDRVGDPKEGFYDYLTMRISPKDGTVWTSLVDLCVGRCAEPGAMDDKPYTSRGAVGVQVGGTRILDALDQSTNGAHP